MQYIPWIISGLSFLVAFATFWHNGKKDSRNDIVADATKMDSIKESLLKANMKLDQVCATTNETRSDIKSLNKDIQSMDTRITVLERDLKTAFNWIDEIKAKINN